MSRAKPNPVVAHFVNRYQEFLSQYSTAKPLPVQNESQLQPIKELPSEEQSVPVLRRAHTKSNAGNCGHQAAAKAAAQSVHKRTVSHALPVSSATGRGLVRNLPRNMLKAKPAGIGDAAAAAKKRAANHPISHNNNNAKARVKTQSQDMSVTKYIAEMQKKQRDSGTVQYIIDSCDDPEPAQEREAVSQSAVLRESGNCPATKKTARGYASAQGRKSQGHRRTESIRFDQTMISHIKKATAWQSNH